MNRFAFNRLEFAGSLGDLGTLLPLSIGMVLICGLNPTGVFVTIGLFYLCTGLYFGITVPTQPMKTIGAYAIAMALSASEILASGLLMATIMLIIGATGAMNVIGRYTPKATIRGVQLATGTLLMAEGVKLIIGTSKIQILRQVAEPYLQYQTVGPVPIGMIIGILGGAAALYFLDNRKLPAGLILVIGGAVIGLIFGNHDGLDKIRLGLYLPRPLAFAFPDRMDFTFALFALVLPQLPMTIGNAVLANADLSKEYFGNLANKMTYEALCIAMALVNFVSFFLGGIPLCTGAGGLAAHYRFGARTGGSNIIIGAIFMVLAIFMGFHILSLLYLIPMAILGVLLVFSGSQLALAIIDVDNRKDLFVTIVMLGITLAVNLAAGFIVGICLAYALKSDRLNI